MFTYIDPTVRERLAAAGKFFKIDRIGGGTISVLGPIPMPLTVGNTSYSVQWYATVRNTELTRLEDLAAELRAKHGERSFAELASSMAVNSVLIIGDPNTWTDPLIRVHSSCLTGDVFGSQRCECGPQFESAMEKISADEQGGMLIYMAGHEGRGIGLWAKAATYLLQDSGEDTYQANRSLGLPDDSRDFSDAAALIRHFRGDGPFRLLTNNPKKVADLNAAGLTGITPVKHVFGVTAANKRYLSAKRDWGHRLDDEDIS
ncbi:MAG: GTP cyclohydrolase II [Woeseiaceae bacterium]|jgi:GTP cyclohydrolase II